MEHEYIKLLPKGYYINGKAWDNSLYNDVDFKELKITVHNDCENYSYNTYFYTGDMPKKIYNFNLLNHKWNLVWGSAMKVYSRLR